MSSCCSEFCSRAGSHFDAGRAESDLRRYLKKGLAPTACLIRDLVLGAGGGRTLLDIGGGIGALTFELMNRGFANGTIVEASQAFVDAARGEAERRGQFGRISVEHADFVVAGRSVPQADVVVLDRVVCCYPSLAPLFEEALRHSRRLLALSYPRDRWHVRHVAGIQNLLRAIFRNPFRFFVHPPSQIRTLASRHGFECLRRKETFTWCVEIYAREGGGK